MSDAWDFILDIAGARHQMADAHMDTGRTQEQRCNFQAAAASYLQAARLQPENAEVWTALGILWNILDMHDKAEGALRYALALNPGQVQATCGMATRHLQQGQPDVAEKWLYRATALAGDIPDILLGRANVAMGRDDPPEAERLYRRVLAMMPESAPAWSSLGNALLEQGRHQEAREAYAKAHAIRPDDSRLEMNLGLLELLVGDNESGWRHYESRRRAMELR